MNLHKINIGKLFYNNKIVMIISVILSFTAWVFLSKSSSETATKLISEIPITIPLSDSAKESGLTIFGVENVKAEISVTGNRLVLGQLTKNDIKVIAQQSANMINSSGNYTLELIAKKNGILTDYEFSTPTSPKFINVLVDREKTQKFDIIPEIKFTVSTNYFVSPIELSESQVEISGPESVVSNINKVIVESSIPDKLYENKELQDLQIILLDDNNNKINTRYLNLNVTKVNANINVSKKKTVNVMPEFTSVPSGINSKLLISQITPSSIDILAPDKIIDNCKNISLEPIDFSQINADNTHFDQKLKIPDNFNVLNNIYSAKVSLNLSGFQNKTLNITNIKFNNLAENKTITSHTMSLPVQFVGPTSQIRNLSANDISVETDLSGKENFVGSTQIPAKIIINSSANRCWIFGTYAINVVISQK